ncbi:MAG: hypothetical protein LBD56_01650 [Endomicrobium sp.]|jgi:hypothetical protein|nr:hypothetical protein [Endomicrobium sp.]
MTKVKKTLAVCLSVALITASIPPREVEASWFSDLMGGMFTIISSPLLLIAPNNPTLRKNNPFRPKAWEEESVNEYKHPTSVPKKTIWEELREEFEEKLKKEREERLKLEAKRAAEIARNRFADENIVYWPAFVTDYLAQWKQEARLWDIENRKRWETQEQCVPSDMPVDFKGSIKDWIHQREINTIMMLISDQNQKISVLQSLFVEVKNNCNVTRDLVEIEREETAEMRENFENFRNIVENHFTIALDHPNVSEKDKREIKAILTTEGLSLVTKTFITAALPLWLKLPVEILMISGYKLCGYLYKNNRLNKNTMDQLLLPNDASPNISIRMSH